jgi:hypothetical protein
MPIFVQMCLKVSKFYRNYVQIHLFFCVHFYNKCAVLIQNLFDAHALQSITAQL